MQPQSEVRQPRVIQIGPDRVTVTDEKVCIEARHEMADWTVRDFNVAPVYFEDRKYHLVQKQKADPPFAVRYILKPWSEDIPSNAKRFHTYDAGAVAERDAHRRSDRRDEAARVCLLPFYPFLGFLWSGAQERLVRFGFVPRAITSISIFTTFCLAFVQGVFAAVLINASLRGGRLMIGGMIRAMTDADSLQIGPVAVPVMLFDSLLLFATVLDVAIRYSNYLREDQWIGGFLEWAIPASLRKKAV